MQVMSKGAVALANIAHKFGRGGIAHLSSKLGCASAMAARWANGERKPGLEWALKIQSVFGIDPSHWSAPDEADAIPPTERAPVDAA